MEQNLYINLFILVLFVLWFIKRCWGKSITKVVSVLLKIVFGVYLIRFLRK